jgi:hypothetical protein
VKHRDKSPAINKGGSSEQMNYFLRDYREEISAGVGFSVVLGFFLIVWFRSGRDPQAGVIVVRYSPPDGMSPAVMRYVGKMGYDDKTLASSLINMAVKGHLSISEDDGTFTLRKKDGEGLALSPEERQIMQALLDSRMKLYLSRPIMGRLDDKIIQESPCTKI